MRRISRRIRPRSYSHGGMPQAAKRSLECAFLDQCSLHSLLPGIVKLPEYAKLVPLCRSVGPRFLPRQNDRALLKSDLGQCPTCRSSNVITSLMKRLSDEQPG